ncbi:MULTISPECIES: DUF2125 domain-containing protein [Bradyrhizobium]|uniref:DUF2125 domain-containing protein n=1 Tax=Bradyrhizobium TaxID=374 RepID=UPI00188BDEE0|nr:MULTISPECIES: DUF2125 domain-containing protein [Bradyrhizobium]MCC8937279.1 DUF2125 domain-containing protein [Bradyrhizobium ivorense]QOZ28891.1 hypothetical protein XH93_39060 [Bradyrhizobium sp. CCBAU 51753]
MSDLTPRRRSRFGLYLVPALVLIAAVLWSAFWWFAASQVGVQADAWRAQEAKAGRVYDCGNRSVAGYPFRFEVRCTDPSVMLVSQTAAPQMAFVARLAEILVVAQVYDPKLVIAEFKGPATLAERGAQPNLSINWRSGRSSVVGLPAVPQRASLLFDDLAIDRIGGPAPLPVARVNHIELHGRQVDGSAPDSPAIETVLQINGGTLQDVHPLLTQPFNADIHARLNGLKDFSPKPWPDRFREIQAAGGSVEIQQSRIEQGDLLSVAAGTLRLNAQGRIEGELQMTVAGIERVIPALGIDKMLEEGVPQSTLDRVAPGVKSQDVSNLFGALDRAIPGLGKVIKQNANAGISAGINSLGKDAVLEGKKARSFPLRFADGAVFLGPLKVGQIPPLF